jgi:rod shape-determining protein MreD
MRGFAFLLLAFLLLALESPLLHAAGAVRYAPDLALITVVYLGLSSPLGGGMATVLGVGLLRDAFTTGTPVGLFMEIAVIIFLICQRLARRLVVRGALGSMVVVAVFSVVSAILEILLSLLFVRTFTQGTSGPGAILLAMIPQALVTAPFAALLFWLFDRVDGLVTRKQDSVFG